MSTECFTPVGVIGSGAWGVALACAARNAGAEVRLLARTEDAVADLRAGHSARLPGAYFAPLEASTDPAHLSDCAACFLASPAQEARAALARAAPCLRPGIPLALSAKGIEAASLKLMSEMLAETCSSSSAAILSGPSFAAEMIAGKPTAITLACKDPNHRAAWLATLSQKEIRLYPSDDIIGAQIGGAVKNVLAIGCGIADGMMLGYSAQASLMARGFAEMSRLGIALGARAETMTGLSGLGDLALTCFSSLSRNRCFGVALGSGQTPRTALVQAKGVVEGAASASALVALAARFGVDMPVSAAVAAIIDQKVTVKEALDRLLARPVKMEAVSS